uniref:Ig-like domain-containing protein n=1 Tax=Chrysemys picta bellii TaxID=8478 RepID=A0A8C3IU80_CHRPI
VCSSGVAWGSLQVTLLGAPLHLTLHSPAPCIFEPPGCKEMEVAAIAGESVQLLPVKLPETWTELTWEVTLDSAETYRIVTFNKVDPPDLGSSPHFINRVTFHPESLSLQFDPVKKSDRGLYSLLIDIGGGREDRTKFRVSVFEPVPEPTVLCDSVTCVSETCNYNLSCRVRDGGEHVTYSWTHTAGGAVVPNESILHISLSPRDAHLAVTCTAQNPASNSSTTASAKDLCAGNSVCRIALPTLTPCARNTS